MVLLRTWIGGRFVDAVDMAAQDWNWIFLSRRLPGRSRRSGLVCLGWGVGLNL